jgi:aryl-alcohol dehydrogenase-like predicted oxidoreductase
MLSRPLGATGLDVSILGYGAMQIGAPAIDDGHAARMLNHVLDRGITLIDTARAYGLAEERIGRHLARRRREYLLSTKVGYGVEGVPDWTAECVRLGVAAACRRLGTDWIDIVHLHSCDRRTLESSGVLEALVRCRDAGQIRCVAYSGENDALAYALSTGLVDVIQLSVNVCDQCSLDWLDGPRGTAVGVLAKRPFAERPWSRASQPDDPPAAEYWRRFTAMYPGEPDADWHQRALRFAAFAPGVDCCIVGTTSREHLDANLATVERGPLPEGEFTALRTRFAPHRAAWPGVI